MATRGASPRAAPPTRRFLAAGAATVSASAVLGAAGLATGADPYLRHLTGRLPLQSPVLGAAALTAVVGVPYAALARAAWRGDPTAERMAVSAGSLLVGWLLVEAAVLREPSILDPVYGAVGVATVLAGLRQRGGRG